MIRSAAPWLVTSLALLGLFLAVLILRDGRANWAVENRPGNALAWAPDDPRALAGAADAALIALKTPAETAGVDRLARAALARVPAQMDALSDLGLAAAVRGDVAQAQTILKLVAARDPLEPASHFWLLKYALIKGDAPGLYRNADALLRVDPSRLTLLAPYLIAAAGPGARALTVRLATNPPWRAAFLTLLAQKSPDPALAFIILTGLAATSAPPTADEAQAYFDRRLADHAYQTAYLDWLQLLPPGALAKAAAVYDGDFAGLPGAGPFNWTFGSGVGGEAQIGPAPDGAPGGALDVHYDGYATPDLADQLLALAPGAYRLTGVAHTTGAAAGALAWTVGCAEGPNLTPTPTPTPDASQGWRAFSLDFTVPDSGCQGQWLRLTPLPGDHQKTLEVWYRHLAIHSP